MTRKTGSLTQRGHNATVLLHELPVQGSLVRIQQGPLLIREPHGNLLKSHQSLEGKRKCFHLKG